jgi:SAM-dependent methyltransferase
MSAAAVFNDDYAKGYDALYREKDYRAEVNLIEAALGLAGRGAELLDLGCGTGGHAIELARRGHTVTGVDLSPHMLLSARRKAEAELEAARRPQFQQGDARSFSVGEGSTFDAVVMMFAVIGYLNGNEDVVSALRRVRAHLRPGGLFLCDFWWGPAVLTQRPGERVRVVEEPGGKLLRATRTDLDTLHNTADVHFELFRFANDKGAVQSSETHRMRYFFGPELELLLQAAGLQLERLSQFMKLGEAPTDDSWNAMLVARAV